MSERDLSGQITHVFAHRFVVQTQDGPVLADLTPKGIEQVALAVGDSVALRGETKPSELKVSHLTRGGRTVTIEHKQDHKKHEHEHHPYADPTIAFDSARAAGFEPIGDAQRKPKHFEVLGQRRGELSELHIELDGHIRKTKPVSADDHKWNDALRTLR